jgi:hypothetical protein
MKPQYLLRAFLLAGFLLLLFLPARGQITITKADVESATAVGTTATGYITPFGSKPVVHLGPASGVAQTWDFRSYTYQTSIALEWVDPSSAPHIASFPQANVVLKQWDEASQTNEYQYNQLTDTEYLLHGTGNDSDTNLTAYNPPEPQMKFPLTLGASWTWTRLPTTPLPGWTVRLSCKWTADAFGTVQLPEGDFQALRLRVESVSDAQTPNGSYLRKNLSYNFISKTMNWVYIYVDTNDIGKEDVTTGGIGYQFGSNTDAVESHNQFDRSFILGNHPNPFIGQTTISFQLAASGYVTLKVYDALGRLVRTLAEDEKIAGPHSVSFDASGLPGGMYFYRLTVGNRTMCAKAMMKR